MTSVATRLAALALAGALAACQQTPKIDPLAGGGGLGGSWAPETGGYTATFANGVFRTTATDTGNVISEGGYTAISAAEVELRWQSRITNLPNQAKCNRPDANTLMCTDQAGKAFTLRRIAG
jgi:hypothetical protein